MKSRIIQNDSHDGAGASRPAARTNLAGRIGRWSARHWKTATFGWLAFIVAAAVIGNVVKAKQLDPNKAGSGESGHVQAVLADEWKQPTGEAVIVQSKHGSSHEASFRAASAT